MISIVIPLYNKESQIAQTLGTVLGQNYTDFEVVIVDDGSTDDSATIVKKYLSDPRIRFIHQENAGVSAARNRGIAEAKGEYVAFLDADDEWKPDYLATQYALTQKYPQCSVFAVNYEFRNEKGETTPTIIRKLPFSGSDGILTNYFEMASCSHPPLWTSAVMVCKKAILSIGGFPVGIRAGEDLLAWARLACRYAIAYSTIPFAIYIIPSKGHKIGQRRMEKVDVVGTKLKELYDSYKSVPGLRLYLSHWYKMKASVAMRHGEFKETVQETAKSLWYNKSNYKTLLYIFVSILPKTIRVKLIALEK